MNSRFGWRSGRKQEGINIPTKKRTPIRAASRDPVREFQRVLDRASYPLPLAELQPNPAPGMLPPGTERALDFLHGERGRLIYDCRPSWWLGGVCLQ